MSQIQKMLQDRFHPDISAVETCKIMKSAFPLSQNKRLSRGGVKQTYALGIEIMEGTFSQPELGDRDQLVNAYTNLRRGYKGMKTLSTFLMRLTTWWLSL